MALRGSGVPELGNQRLPQAALHRQAGRATSIRAGRRRRRRRRRTGGWAPFFRVCYFLSPYLHICACWQEVKEEDEDGEASDDEGALEDTEMLVVSDTTSLPKIEL